MKHARLRMVIAALGLVGASALGAGCNKPSEESCRKALGNLRQLLGTDKLTLEQGSLEGEIRRCRGGSSKKSVECAINAKTVEELRACNLVKLPASATPAPAAK